MIAILLATLTAMASYLHQLAGLVKEPKYRAGLVWLLLLQVVAVIFYRIEEGWSWLDCFYFSVVTISTVGYGDLSPTTPLSKIFTMIYILMGISVFVSFASMLAHERTKIHQQRAQKHHKGDETTGAST